LEEVKILVSFAAICLTLTNMGEYAGLVASRLRFGLQL